MKKILAFVLTLAMMLTLLNVGFISTAAKTADGPIVDLGAQATVNVEGTEYTVIDELPTTAGNYILSQDVVAEAGYVFPAGVVLHGNGYTITVEGNDVTAPATEAPFGLPAGTIADPATVVITNVNFGTATAPIYLLANELNNDVDNGCVCHSIVKDIGLFANDGTNYDFVEATTPNDKGKYIHTEGDFESNNVALTFDSVTFNVSITAIAGDANVGGIMGSVYGNHVLNNCTMNATLNAGDANAAATTSTEYGYAGLYYGRVLGLGSVTMTNCVTTAASVITNNFTCGGFIGYVNAKGTAGAALISCENYAKVSAADAAVGGLIGWIDANYSVEGELLVFNGLTNYGDVYSNIGVGNEGAGGIVGHIYYNKTGTDTTTDADITFNNCVNYGNLYTKGYAGGIVCISRVGKYGFDKGSMTYNNCVNYGLIEDTDPRLNSVTEVQCLKGGITARPYGQATLNGCGNYGSVLEGDDTIATGDQIGGLIGGTYTPQVPDTYTEDYIVLTNCVNYGAVMTGRRIGGFAGTGEAPMTFINCVNYGTTGDCGAAIGGFVGYNANNGAYRHDLTFINCVNYGSTTDTDTCAGFVGQSMRCTFENCINLADMDGTGNVGGFSGWHRTGYLDLVDCINVGGSWGYNSGSGGNIVGNFSGGTTFTVANFLSYGVFTGFTAAGKLNGVVGSGSVVEPTMAEGAEFFAEVLMDTEPVNEEGKPVVVWQDSAEEAAAKVNARLEEMGLPATVYATAEGTLMVVNPMLRGVQKSEIVDGEFDVRILGALDGNLPFYDGVIGRQYDNIVLNYKVVEVSTAASPADLVELIDAADAQQAGVILYETINNVIGYNELLGEKVTEQITNYDMAAQFIVGGVIEGVSAEGDIAIVASMTTILDGVEYNTATYLFAIEDGEIIMVLPYDLFVSVA